MTNEITTRHPTDTLTGLTLPLSRSLGSQEFKQHRATVAFEMEVLAKKVDRFGWDRDRGTAAQDRLIMDWMDALGDYPLSEIQAACNAAVLADPKRMPNEGHVVAHIMAARQRKAAQHKARNPAPQEPARKTVDKAEAAKIMAAAGFTPKRMGA